MRTLTYLYISVLFFCAVTVQAQDKRDEIRKMIEITNTNSIVNVITDAMIANMNKVFTERYKKKNTAANLNKFMGFVRKEIKATMDLIVKNDLVDLYDKNFTHDEIKNIIKFYESSAGQKLLNLTPILSKNIKELIDKKYRDSLIQRLQEEAKKFLKTSK